MYTLYIPAGLVCDYLCFALLVISGLQQKIGLRVLQMITFCCVPVLSSGCP